MNELAMILVAVLLMAGAFYITEKLYDQMIERVQKEERKRHRDRQQRQ